MKRFDGSVAMVTGGVSGIGDAVVRNLLGEGAQVIVLDMNEELLAERHEEFGPAFYGIAGNVTDETSVSCAVEKGARHFGGLDIAFNIAGASRNAPIVDQSVCDWNFTLDVCLKGVMLCLKHQAREIRMRGQGAIVNVASVCAHMAVYGGAAYCSAKAGVEMLSKVAALELAEGKIRVNSILPGYTPTPGMQLGKEAPAQERAILDRIPLGRSARVEEIAAPTLFLASADATYITGASLVVDGGWELRR
jgi:NAD(P)-dependent dehydrogenase (short-subunit alcohol dehydrogenase family)